MNSQEQPERSVFAEVDQEEMIRRLSQAAADEVETTFFDETLREPDADGGAHLQAGIRAFTGVDVTVPGSGPRDPQESVGLRAPQRQAPIVVEGPISDEPSAVRAFILFGPVGIVRPHGHESRRTPGIVRGLRRKGSTS